MKTPAGNGPRSRPLVMRILVRPLAYRHPYAYGTALFAVGVWLFVLGGILCSVGYWWAALLIAVAALQFLVGCHLLSSAQRTHAH